ncbi:MAG: two-component regulator propeller domain-containing protein [Bacteroidia bacterium]
MNLNKIVTEILAIIVSTMFISCGSKGNTGSTENLVVTDSLKTKVDSTHWLKPTEGVRGMFEDSKGNLWFTTVDYVSVFDGSKQRYFTEEDGLSNFGQVHEDSDGTIWVESGFNAYSYDGVRFTSHNLIPDTLSNQWSVSPNDLWFQKGIPRLGNSDGPPGVYRCRNGEINFLAFPLPYRANADNVYHPTTKAIKGKDGMIWFGTIGAVIGFKDGAFTIIGQEVTGKKNEPSHIRDIYVDSKGNLWMADNGNGVFVFNGDTTINFTKSHHLDMDDSEGNTLLRSFCIAEDKDGYMWFGTVYSGIWRYDGVSFTNFTEKDGVVNQSFWTIFKNKKGELLFCGENPGGVYKFNGLSFDRVY